LGSSWGNLLKMARILVVEDENYLAMELSWLIQEAGHSVLGPERSVQEAHKALTGKVADLALLDVNLGGETVFPVAKLLECMDIPFIFITAHFALLPAEYRHRPLMTKPCKPQALLMLIPAILAQRAASARQPPMDGPPAGRASEV